MTRLDRRALFATGSAAALLAAAGVSAQAAPQRGGHLRAGLSGGDRSESWIDVPGGRFLQAARNAIFETLTEIAADGTLQPGLATRWASRDGGRVWHFDLRSDVMFHDGTTFGPDDAVASLEAVGLVARSRPEGITVQLDSPDPAFPFRIARDGFAMFRADEAAAGTITSGTGLYRIKRFDAGRGLMAERVSTHRKDGQAGWFDTVELVAVSDESVRAEAIRDGYVDVVDVATDHDLQRLGDVRLLSHQGRTHAALRNSVTHHPRTGPAPLDDMRFAERWWMAT